MRKKRKVKSRRLEDAIQKHLDEILDQQHLETPNKRKKLVKKQLIFSTGLESSDDQKSKNQRSRKNAAKNQVRNNSGLSPEGLEMLESPTKRN